MLGAIAAIALVVGGISTTVVLTDEGQVTAQESHQAVVEVQTIESADEAPINAFDF